MDRDRRLVPHRVARSVSNPIITGVTIYQPTIFRMAGISNEDSGWVSGLNNTVYMVSHHTHFVDYRPIPTATFNILR